MLSASSREKKFVKTTNRNFLKATDINTAGLKNCPKKIVHLWFSFFSFMVYQPL